MIDEIFQTVDALGVIHYTNKNGQAHNEEGPATISRYGYQAWFINGKLHREDGPAQTWGQFDNYREFFIKDRIFK